MQRRSIQYGRSSSTLPKTQQTELDHSGLWFIGAGFYAVFVAVTVGTLTVARLDDLNRLAEANLDNDIPPDPSDRLSLAFHQIIADKPFSMPPGLPGPIHTLLYLLVFAYALWLLMRYLHHKRNPPRKGEELPYQVWL